MLMLNDPQWKLLEGGYGYPYDASTALKELETTNDEERITQILYELSSELYHQGDVGLASYYALPHLIRIGIEKEFVGWEILGLVALVEIGRHRNNPQLPQKQVTEYLTEIKEVIKLVEIGQRKMVVDRSYAAAALSAIAAVNGQIDMAVIILEMEDRELTQDFDLFLEEYDKFKEYLQE